MDLKAVLVKHLRALLAELDAPTHVEQVQEPVRTAPLPPKRDAFSFELIDRRLREVYSLTRQEREDYHHGDEALKLRVIREAFAKRDKVMYNGLPCGECGDVPARYKILNIDEVKEDTLQESIICWSCYLRLYKGK